MPERKKKLLPNGGYPMHTFEDVRERYFAYITNPNDRKMIESAYLLAKEKHEGQFRRSGEAYIQHPIEVAYILTELQSGPATIASGFLHDVVEDTDTTIEYIASRFGEEVAKIVDALTKIQRMKLSHMTAEDFEAEDHRKIFLGMAQDVRVILVKLADRLHNLRTMDALSPERQVALSRETIDVFVPIAHRLGIYTLQSELQDLSLKYLEPAAYKRIQELVNDRFNKKKESLDNLKKRIADILFEQKIPFRMESRVKSIYSIYRKMYEKDHDFDDIYDVLALRIITESVLNCYEILGIVHSTYTPIPGRFKDYIAMPKPNLYQSLHTSVLAGDGNSYEIQIRTEEMDQIAETGVAAHWRYKEGTRYNAKDEQKDIEENLAWFRDFVSLSEDNQSKTAKEYMSSLTNDIFGANVYVFTPMGKVIDLPAGSTPLDFAYKIHTRVGDTAVGALVNGVGVALNTVLKTGDVCEIRTSKNAQPNDSWLNIAKTASAKAHIRRALQKRDEEFLREDRIKTGRAALLDSFRLNGFGEEEALGLIDFQKIENEFHISNMDDLCVAIANRNPTASAVLSALNVRKKPNITEYASRPLKPKEVDDNPIQVGKGMSGLAISLSHCCNPIPGDDVVGYITKGKGITVHRRNCPNIAGEQKRLIDVSWKRDLGPSTYPVDIQVFANDRPNLLAAILQTLGAKGVGVSDLHAKLLPETMNDIIEMTVSVPDAKVLQDAFADLLGIKGVYEIKRIIH